MAHKPKWFRDGKVFVSFAETVGINKDGHELYVVDAATGKRTETIDDAVARDLDDLIENGDPLTSPTSRWVEVNDAKVAVPVYFDDRHEGALEELLTLPEFAQFERRTLGELEKSGAIESSPGHGSPSADMRTGNVPYIKVSDIRAGQVNINPSNMVPRVVAEKYWKGSTSGLKAFDLVSPIRTSKNIGEFAVLMPGQEQSVFTKEVLVLRASPETGLDNFFLLWALSLKVVRNQWKRVVFMQTNREDVGQRYKEIALPWPKSAADGLLASAAFRDYYHGMEELRRSFLGELASKDRYHVFLGDGKIATSATSEETN